MSEQQRKRAAKEAITGNTVTLNNALSSNEANFRDVVGASVECKIVTKRQQTAFLDTMCGKTLQARVQDFVSQITDVVGVLPHHLDDFALILFNAGTMLRNAAEEIATECE